MDLPPSTALPFLSALFRRQLSLQDKHDNTGNTDYMHTSDPSPKFPPFPRLPPELRLQIWEIAYHSLPKDRIISLCDHHPNSDNDDNITHPPFVRNDRHALLHACSESRSVVFPLLTSSFGPPASGYHLIDHNRSSRRAARFHRKLIGFLANQGFSDEFVGLNRAAEAALVHFNANHQVAAKHPKIFKQGAPFPKLVPALWFDSDSDYLLISLSRGPPLARTEPRWNMCGTLLAANVKRIALEIGRSDWDWSSHHNHAILPKIWSTTLETGGVDFPALDKVQEIYLWTREGCEVCHFGIAPPSSKLKAGEWSFSLDTSAVTPFSDRFRERWSRLTWQVLFGRTPDPTKDSNRLLNVCEMLRDWKPHSARWWHDKLEITRDFPDAGATWREMVHQWEGNHQLFGALTDVNHPRPGRLVKLDWEEEGRAVYLGPSFDPW